MPLVEYIVELEKDSLIQVSSNNCTVFLMTERLGELLSETVAQRIALWWADLLFLPCQHCIFISIKWYFLHLLQQEEIRGTSGIHTWAKVGE